MKIVIFGPQGSGKGTQAKILSAKLKVPHISMGDLFRENIAQQTEPGRQAKKYHDLGRLVPDDLTIQLINDRLSQSNCRFGFILDGFPRTVPQAQALAKIVQLDKVLEIWISDAETIRRLGSRRSCIKCGAIYHLEFNPSKVPGQCNECGSQLVIREDDTAAIIKERLAQYHQQTEPIKEFYQRQNKLVTIDGTPPIAEVTGQIVKQLNL